MSTNIIGKVGFRYIEEIRRPPKEAITKALSYDTANISDGSNKFYTMDYNMKPIYPGYRVAGPAVTVKVRSADNLMLHKSIEIARLGDILVVETQGCYNYAVLGDIIASSVKGKGIAGIVVDGSIRDLRSLKELGLPIFAKGAVSGAGDKEGPGEINFPICCGGVVVMPGDIILGDDDGVVVIPQNDYEEIFAAADKKLFYEAKRRKEIEKGLFVKPGLDDILAKKGVGKVN